MAKLIERKPAEFLPVRYVLELTGPEVQRILESLSHHVRFDDDLYRSLSDLSKLQDGVTNSK